MNNHQFFGLVGLACGLVLAGSSPAQGAPAKAMSVDLDAALQLARDNSPGLDASRAGIEQVHGDLTSARAVLADGPYVRIGAGPRLGQSGPRTQGQFQAAVRQRLEVAGQRKKRTRVATTNLHAARYDHKDQTRRLELDVAVAFFSALAAAQRLELAIHNERLTAEIEAVAQRRVDAGADSPTLLNAAKIRSAHAGQQRLAAELDVASSKLVLAAVIGLPPSHTLAPTGTLTTTAQLPSVEGLLATAGQKRPDILAASQRAKAAVHGEAVVRAETQPDLSLGVRYSFEEGDSVIMGTIGVWLPSLGRSRGARRTARAATKKRQAQERATRLRANAEIRTSAARLRAATKAAALYDGALLALHSENMKLLQQQYAQGKVTYVELVLLRRELLEAQLGHLQARLEVATAHAALLSAANRPLTTTVSRKSL